MLAICMIQEIIDYLKNEIGAEVEEFAISENEKQKLPRYLKYIPEYLISLNGNKLLLSEKIALQDTSPERLEFFRDKIEENFNLPLVFCPVSVDAYERKQLIRRRLAFILPGKQVYIPSLIISLSEIKKENQKNRKHLSPSAQCLILYHLQNTSIEGKSLTEISALFRDYNLMALSRACKEFVSKNLCTVTGNKEKHLKFKYSGLQLWNALLPYLQSPVVKRLYADSVPELKGECLSGDSALAQFSELVEPVSAAYAISKKNYSKVKDTITDNESSFAGKDCLEIWSYQPDAAGKQKGIADPLSLSLCYRDSADERIQQAVNNLVKKVLC